MKIDDKNRVYLPKAVLGQYGDRSAYVGVNPISGEILILPTVIGPKIVKQIEKDYPGFENYRKRTQVSKNVASLFVNSSIQGKGQVVIPDKFLGRINLSQGEIVDCNVTQEGIVKIKKKAS